MLDIGIVFLYDGGMKQISIKQLQDILGISYPTALDFAKQHGEQNGDGERAQWFIPLTAVSPLVENEQKRVAQMAETYAMYLDA